MRKSVLHVGRGTNEIKLAILALVSLGCFAASGIGILASISGAAAVFIASVMGVALSLMLILLYCEVKELREPEVVVDIAKNKIGERDRESGIIQWEGRL